MAASFAERLAAVLNGRLVGVYLVGSYALGDLQRESDVDFLAAVEGGVPSTAVEQLRSLHALMTSSYPHRPFDGFYVDPDDLRHHPDPSSKGGLQFLDDTLRENTKVRLVEWEMLRRCGHVVTGRQVGELGVLDASADLAAFSRRNLLDYWTPWLERTAPYLMDGDPIGPKRTQMAWAAAWCVLGVPRLHVAIADGDIVSKTEAGIRALSRFDPGWHAVIDAALDYRRRGDEAAIDQLATMRMEALAFARHALETALT